VSAVETHYYWPDPAADMREVLRVLKPGARFVLIAETYKGERLDRLLAIPMKLLRARYSRSRSTESCWRPLASWKWRFVSRRRKAGSAELPEGGQGCLPNCSW
jgi:SAM-dependent methyltransferase